MNDESWGEKEIRKHPWRWRWARFKLLVEDLLALVGLQYSAEDDAYDYESVTLTKVGTIRVRYKPAEALKPRRYTIEDDDH